MLDYGRSQIKAGQCGHVRNEGSRNDHEDDRDHKVGDHPCEADTEGLTLLPNLSDQGSQRRAEDTVDYGTIDNGYLHWDLRKPRRSSVFRTAYCPALVAPCTNADAERGLNAQIRSIRGVCKLDSYRHDHRLMTRCFDNYLPCIRCWASISPSIWARIAASVEGVRTGFQGLEWHGGL